MAFIRTYLGVFYKWFCVRYEIKIRMFYEYHGYFIVVLGYVSRDINLNIKWENNAPLGAFGKWFCFQHKNEKIFLEWF